MWVMVFYDLPVADVEDRKVYARFHKYLIKRGYKMVQFSVYRKYAGTADRSEREIGKLLDICPPKGVISVLQITEKQMGRMTTIWNGSRHKEIPRPRQLILV